jgi:hypothetical protein
MSVELPAKPDLEHLKRQAKDPLERGEKIRLISARPATRRERRDCEEQSS